MGQPVVRRLQRLRPDSPRHQAPWRLDAQGGLMNQTILVDPPTAPPGTSCDYVCQRQVAPDADASLLCSALFVMARMVLKFQRGL